MSGDTLPSGTARRRNIRAVLKQLSPRILSFFDRAVSFAGEVESDDSAVPMLGHALREMTRILPRFVDIPVDKERVKYDRDLDRIAKDWPAVDREHRVLTPRQFETLDGLVIDHVASRGRADARASALARTSAHGRLDEDATLLEGLKQRWKKLEREFSELTHVGDDGSVAPAADALNVFERFEELLDHTLADFWGIDAKIKETIAAGASAATYARVKELPKTIQHWRRLYQQLGAEWLRLVVSSGDMERPPLWVVREERPLAWPVLDYVERAAETDRVAAAEALLRVPSRINTFAQAQVLQIAMTLEPADVRPLAERARAWVKADASNMLLTERAGQFMARLADAGLVEEAIAVASELLATRMSWATDGIGRDRQRALEPHIGLYEGSQMLKTHFPAVVRAAPARAIKLLIERLAAALAWIGPQYWRIWLPDITQPRTREGVVEMLVVATYRATLETANSNAVAAQEILDDLAGRAGAIMRRLEFAILGQTALGSPRLNDLYRDRSLFDDPEVFHEYVETLVKRWAVLDEATRDGIRQWIRAGPTYTPRGDEDRDRLFAHWRRRLLAVLDPVLPPDWREEFVEVLQLPAPEHPSHLSWSTLWSGPNSPLTAEQIHGMSTESLLEFLQGWSASTARGGPEPSVEGLSRVLGSVVAAGPERFVSDLALFRKLVRSEYVNAVTDGLVQAVRAGMSLDWDPVVEHLEAELVRAAESGDAGEADGIVWSAVRLLEEAMGSGRAAYPSRLRQRTFALIRKLAAHGGPGPSAEEPSLQHGINTIRGAALEAAIRYGLWVAAIVEVDATQRPLTENLKELGELLAIRLGDGGEDDYSIRAIAGAFLPQLVYLDREWVAANLDDLLPVPAGGGTDAPSAAFLEFGAPFFGEIYALLRSRYGAALDVFSADSSPNEDQIFRVGLHSLIAHTQSWDAQAGLLDRFFEVASAAVRGRLIQQVGTDLADQEALFLPDMVVRLEALWRQRIERAQDPSEMREFGLWFASGRFDAAVSLDLLRKTLVASRGRVDSEDDVAVRLRELARDHPAASLELFDQMLANLDHPWTASRLEADGLVLVRLGLAHSDDLVRRHANRIRDRFGRLGFSSFENLDEGSQRRSHET
jgi:hypothetical protein